MEKEAYGSEFQVMIEEICAVLIVLGVFTHIFGRIFWGW